MEWIAQSICTTELCHTLFPHRSKLFSIVEAHLNEVAVVFSHSQTCPDFSTLPYAPSLWSDGVLTVVLDWPLCQGSSMISCCNASSTAPSSTVSRSLSISTILWNCRRLSSPSRVKCQYLSHLSHASAYLLFFQEQLDHFFVPFWGLQERSSVPEARYLRVGSIKLDCARKLRSYWGIICSAPSLKRCLSLFSATIFPPRWRALILTLPWVASLPNGFWGWFWLHRKAKYQTTTVSKFQTVQNRAVFWQLSPWSTFIYFVPMLSLSKYKIR